MLVLSYLKYTEFPFLKQLLLRCAWMKHSTFIWSKSSIVSCKRWLLPTGVDVFNHMPIKQSYIGKWIFSSAFAHRILSDFLLVDIQENPRSRWAWKFHLELGNGNLTVTNQQAMSQWVYTWGVAVHVKDMILDYVVLWLHFKYCQNTICVAIGTNYVMTVMMK